jgi:hypothetical protein
MTETSAFEKIDRLLGIQEEMKKLLREAEQLLRGTAEENRARGNWMAHIRRALDDDHGFLGGSMLTMQDTIEALDEAHED